MIGEQSFGGDWTQEKLERIKKYLPAFTKIITTYFKHTEYIDAFAGTGYRELKNAGSDKFFQFEDDIDQDTEKFAEGSARIALNVSPPFTRYIFIEKSKSRFEKLKTLKTDFPD